MSTQQSDRLAQALDRFRVELPSWGFSNTGTRFGKYTQPAAAATIEEKFSDAAQVHGFTGACPTLAVHVLWDLPNGAADVPKIETLARRHGIAPGTIKPKLFSAQLYKVRS